MQKNKKKNQRGITLVALVVTIIVLIILATISINIIFGENGILERALQGQEDYNEAQAREKLALALGDLAIEKETNVNYNDEYINETLVKQGMAIDNNTVIVDGYSFLIDRAKLEIIENLGKGEITENEEIEIAHVVTNSSDYGSANIQIEITYTGNITSIELNGSSVEIPEKTDGKYVISTDVTKNDTYTIIVKDENGKYKSDSIDVTELTEDLVITTVEELKAFAEKVDMGGSFEGKTVTLANDLNLNEGKYRVNADGTVTFDEDAEQLNSIGATGGKHFLGIFDGGNHTIKGIYIDNENNYEGLFSANGGTIKNLTVEEGYVKAGYAVGGICGNNYGIIENTINKVDVKSKTISANGNSMVGGIAGYIYGEGILRNNINYGNVTGIGKMIGGIVGYATAEDGIIKDNINYGDILGSAAYVGGICGYLENLSEDITGCANLSNYVKTTGANSTNYSFVGGIVGGNFDEEVTISQCYNTANIIAAKSTAGGIAGHTSGTITKCYNTGNIQSLGVNDSGYNTTGGIVGYTSNTVDSCYNTGDVSVTAKIVGGIVGGNKGTTIIKQEIKNCYNTGTVSSVPYSGGVTGSGIGVSNCYYLTGTASYGIGGSTGSNTNAESKSMTQLQALASTLGSAFVQDEDDINDGYPILSWQVEE